MFPRFNTNSAIPQPSDDPLIEYDARVAGSRADYGVEALGAPETPERGNHFASGAMSAPGRWTRWLFRFERGSPRIASATVTKRSRMASTPRKRQTLMVQGVKIRL